MDRAGNKSKEGADGKQQRMSGKKRGKFYSSKAKGIY